MRPGTMVGRGGAGDARDGAQRDRGLGLLVVVLLVGWAALCAPLVLGRETVYFRDHWNLFLPLRTFGAETFAGGELPATNPTWALGQPFRGNPNTLSFYPTGLLYLALPFWPAFHLHLSLHWLLAALGMGWLARTLGSRPAGAVLAALTYAGSGWMLSNLTFANLVAVAAWLPILMVGLARGGVAGVALAGLAGGLGFLAGEPVTFVIAAAGIGLWLLGRVGWRASLARLLPAAVIGVLVALPQIVAMLRVVPFAFRTRMGMTPFAAGYFHVHPIRWLELLVPLPFGSPGADGTFPGANAAWMPPVPYNLSIHFGIVALALAALGASRRKVLLALGGSGLLLAWLGGIFPDLLRSATFGFYRSPSKLVVWPALALPLLAAAGLDRLAARPPQRVGRILGLGAGSLGAGGLAVALAGPVGAGPIALRCLTAGALLAGLAVAARWGRTAPVVLLQAVALLQLAPLWLTDEVAYYAMRPAWAADLEPGAAVVTAHLGRPVWEDTVDRLRLPPGPPALSKRVEAGELAAGLGVLHGLRYPLAPDLDGLTHVFSNHLAVRMALADWDERIPWLRTLGVDVLVTRRPIARAGLDPAGERPGPGIVSYRYRVRDPAPSVWWPDRVEAVGSPGEVFSRVAGLRFPTEVAFLPVPAEQGSGRILGARESPDRIEIEVEGEGGVLVVQRAFQALWRAHSGDRELQVLPANLALLGVEVPPGRRRVVLEISDRPERVAVLVSALGLFGVGCFAVLAARRRRG